MGSAQIAGDIVKEGRRFDDAACLIGAHLPRGVYETKFAHNVLLANGAPGGELLRRCHPELAFWNSQRLPSHSRFPECGSLRIALRRAGSRLAL